MIVCVCCKKVVDVVVPVETKLMVWAGPNGDLGRTLSLRLFMELDYPENFPTNVCQTCYNTFLKVAEISADKYIKAQERISKDKRVARIRELKDELAALLKRKVEVVE